MHYSFTARSHLAFQELIDHAQDQAGPEDVQSLQHHQQDVKKVVASKRLKHLHGQYQGGVNDSVSNRIARVKLLMRELSSNLMTKKGDTIISYLLGKITSRVTRKTTANTTNRVSHDFLQPAP